MTNRLPPFKSIEAFVVASQTLSFTTTASILCITLPAVSRRIQALEAELGVLLFHRGHRTLQLTQTGVIYADYLAPAIDSIRHASEAVRNKPVTNRVKVSVLSSFATNWILPRFTRFQELHSTIQIDFDVTGEYINFDQSDVDLAIRLGHGGWAGLHVVPLLDIVVFPVCSPRLLDGGHPIDSPDDLFRYLLLSPACQPELWPNMLSAIGVREQSRANYSNFTSFHLLFEAAAQGLGIAIAPDALVGPYLDSGRLVRLLPDNYFRWIKKFYLICRIHDRDRLPVRAVHSWLMREAAECQRRDLSEGRVAADRLQKI
jgi:LysR family glycine cleavage system transcriptional activator